MKSAGDRMDIISAYQQLGSYRAAAELCGTTHKTVKRVVEKFEADQAGTGHHRGSSDPMTTMRWLGWSLNASRNLRAGS